MIYWKDFVIGDEILGSYLRIQDSPAEDLIGESIMDDEASKLIQETARKQRPARMVGSKQLLFKKSRKTDGMEAEFADTVFLGDDGGGVHG